MNAKKEQISFQVYHGKFYSPEFFSGFTIFFGLSGKSIIRYRSEQFEMGAGALLTVDPFEIFQIDCPEDAEIMAMKISDDLLKLAGWTSEKRCFCYAEGSNNSEQYLEVRKLLATIFRDFVQNKGKNTPFMISRGIELVHLMVTRFHMQSERGKASRREENMKRVKRVMDYIHQHWNENISLHELAEREFLSEGYLSRFLKQNLDMTFSQYVMNLRLEHAERSLRDTDYSVTHIAYDCGFHNASSFIENFQRKNGVTPGKYRAEADEEKAGNQEKKAESLNDGFANLLQYADIPEQNLELPTESRKIEISASGKKEKIQHSWKNLLNVGYAKYLLNAEVQRQIIRTQEEIGFQYIRFHGILDQEIHIYQGKNAEGIRCCFTYLDMILDFLTEQGLKPFLEFSFMPSALAKEEKSIFETGSVTAACADCQTLGLLIEEILRHMIRRYGRREVLSWKFTTLQMNYVFFRCMTEEEYFAIYETVCRAVKNVDPALAFGGPGAMSSVVLDERGMRRFLQFARENDLLPDFVSVQSYPHETVTSDSDFMSYTLNQQSLPSILSGNPDFLKKFLGDLKSLLQEFDLGEKEIYLEEWNSTLWQRDLSSDTCYKSVWLVKNICENMDAAAGFGYWTLSDMIDERSDFDTMYHGGYGLFTYNGLPKSGYEALVLLSKMGQEKIAAGDGWYVTGNGDSMQIILYNYTHYDNIYRYRYRRLTHPEDAYTVFERGKNIRYEITVPYTGDFIVREYEISRIKGSSFDQWLEIGAPEAPDREILRNLKNECSILKKTERLSGGHRIRLETELKPLEVRMFEIKKEI